MNAFEEDQAPVVELLRVEDLQALAASAPDDALDDRLRALGFESADAVEVWAREALDALPTPIRSSGHEAHSGQRRSLQRLAAAAAAWSGRPDDLLDLQRDAWRDGEESAAPFVEHLVALGRLDEAAVWARCALSEDECKERARIEAAVESIGAPPAGWSEAVAAFAEAPSVEAWERLMSFTPGPVYYHRTRNTLRTLIDMGVDGDVLFGCATIHGCSPDAIELVERGLVSPETVIARARQAPLPAEGLWLGLAAQAAFARGDRFRTVRLLREAYDKSSPDLPPVINMLEIRGAGDEELNAMLDKVGVPS